MNRLNSLHQYSEHEPESFLNRIILHLQRTRKLSTISNEKLNSRPVITIHSCPESHRTFTNRDAQQGEMGSDSSSHFHYFHLYLNLSYFLLIVPYRPVYKNGNYKLIKNKFQRVSVFLKLNNTLIHFMQRLYVKI